MLYEVVLPAFGDDALEIATVSLWLTNEGDIVNEDDDLVELTTDKAAFTVPSPKTGTVVQRLVEEEDEVRVGDVICMLEI
jgi:pyruvate dehydrogenase E2 component (dihydrolipoamide acetyltransferase)